MDYNNIKKELDRLFIKYQKGGQIKKQAMDYSYSPKDITGFYSNMLNSQWYKDRIKTNGYEDGWVDPRLARAKYHNPTNQDLEESANEVITARKDNLKGIGFIEQPNKLGSRYNLSDRKVYLDPNQVNKMGAHPRSVVAHEYSHASRNSFPLTRLSRFEAGFIEKNAASPDNYVSDPEEAKSDLDAMRYNLYKAGLFDPSSGKYKTQDGKFNRSLLNSIKNDVTTKRMLETYKEKGIENIMNRVAYNEDINSVDFAKLGGLIKLLKL